MVERFSAFIDGTPWSRLSYATVLALTSIFFSISADAQEPTSVEFFQPIRDTGNIQLDAESELTSENEHIETLLLQVYGELEAEFKASHPELESGVTLPIYYHQVSGLESSILLTDHTYQKLLTLETFAAITDTQLPDSYYVSNTFDERHRALDAALSYIYEADGMPEGEKPDSLQKLITLAARLSQLSEFGIYMKDYAVMRHDEKLLLLHTTPETQVASMGLSFMARHFWSAIQRQQHSSEALLTEKEWLMAMVDSFAYFEGFKAMNPYSANHTAESFAAYLTSEVAHYTQFADYTLSAIDETFLYELEKLWAEQAAPFPVGSAGGFVPYSFYTYPAGHEYTVNFDAAHLPANILYGQRFDDGSVFLIYASGESQNGLSVSQKLAFYQNRDLPDFESWWTSMPQKAEFAVQMLPAARVDANYRLAAELMNIPFESLLQYAANGLSPDTEALFTTLSSDPNLGFEEFVAGKQKLAVVLLLNHANARISHPVLQHADSNSDFNIRDELFDPLAFQQMVNAEYLARADENVVPTTFFPLNKTRAISSLQSLLDFGVVATTYQHSSYAITPEMLLDSAEYLIAWEAEGTIKFFKVDETGETITSIDITVDGDISIQTNQPLPDLRSENIFAVPQG